MVVKDSPPGSVPKAGSGALGRARRAMAALLGAADRVRRDFAQALEPGGITVQQYNVLRILRGAQPEGLPTMAIRARMLEAAPGITGLIDRTETRGWVRREPDPADRREIRCRITAEGLALLDRLDATIDAFDEAAFSSLSASQTETLVRLLEAIRTRPT